MDAHEPWRPRGRRAAGEEGGSLRARLTLPVWAVRLNLAPLALVLMALACLVVPLGAIVVGCGVEVGPTQEFVIDEPLGGAGVTDIVIKMGAGSLTVGPGASGLISGVVRYNVAEWKPELTRSASRLSIKQGGPKGLTGWSGDIVNQWDLRLGKAPMRLEVEAGAYEGEYELGGLTLQSLRIKDGAAKAEVAFSEPNPGRLEVFRYETGASNVSLKGLANANFALLEFKGGAGSYTLDFGGQLRGDGRVRVKAGVGKVRLVVPVGTAARVTVEGSLNDISAEGPWVKKDKIYSTGASGGRAGSSLDIVVEMSVGKLELVAQ